MIDIRCKCGHLRSEHQQDTKIQSGEPCLVLTGAPDSRWVDDCMRYIPDNLSHIEEVAKEKGLI